MNRTEKRLSIDDLDTLVGKHCDCADGESDGLCSACRLFYEVYDQAESEVKP